MAVFHRGSLSAGRLALSKLVLFTIALFAANNLFAADPPEYVEVVRLVRNQQWTEALSRIQKLAERYPGNPKVFNLQGLAFLGAGDNQPAREAFQKALRSHPGFGPCLKNLAILEWNAGEQKAAAEHTLLALRQNPGDPILSAYGVLAAMQRKDASSARSRFAAAGASRSVLKPEMLTKAAVFLGEHGYYAEAAAAFEDMLRRGHDSPGLRYNLGLSQVLLKRFSDAISTLEPVLGKRPSSEIMNLLAQAYEKNGKAQKALDLLRQATLQYPSDENNYLDLATICLDHEAFALGLEVIQVGLKYRPDSAKLRFHLGLLHAVSGDYQQAQADFEEAGKREPASDLPGAALQLTAMQQSHLEDAVENLRAQLKTKPNSDVLWYLLGVALQRRGMSGSGLAQSEVLSAFQHAIQINTKLPYPYIELGKIYVREKRFSEALPLLEKAIELKPEERAPYYQLAIAYRGLSQPERSTEMLAKIRQFMKKDREQSKQHLGIQ